MAAETFNEASVGPDIQAQFLPLVISVHPFQPGVQAVCLGVLLLHSLLIDSPVALRVIPPNGSKKLRWGVKRAGMSGF